jgi:hypothetical protein
MPVFGEASITINGHQLTSGQSMTIRVALENFAMDLSQDGLGDDALGLAIRDGYLTRIREIRSMAARDGDAPVSEPAGAG